ncbi:chloride channel protein [Paracoccus saliphilus]|uniref:Chloride channel protein n=1 Tax=Paracoccus saliphilus TaxID=405559 RepID=A0AA45W598_9RHOB|nr:chloride channel protein [Paracoccus saliphilus]WCR02237.1 chloride channel protein [Paracoccus saliphilus]SIS91709.1 Voltage gated chloride channel [Paracoccus saliphilus]
MSEQIALARQPAATQIHKTGVLALTAIVAVGFGGAVGPEAGILAVVAELSVLVTALLARLHHPADMVGEIGAAGALGGLYGSPPGGAMLLDEEPQAPKWQLYVAALAGLAGFLIVARRILTENALHVDLPTHVAAGDGSEIILAVLPSMLGAAIGWLFLRSLTAIRAGLSGFGAIWQ